ncbi:MULTISPECIES: alpha-D-ribose 1-methylphosphonate 5-triphosphate diphosphatase [unclassified Neorhizobium]|uniref:alpha-D-ribose 1-methylphosphonate 5-triphosphate diphosphatase n=1 Tax=unclassified Neorhizobium TaxID=2629175 RepID=UPI001FF17F65|nr:MULTISPECIES: alpha-D-ribose 1-methylphosphonate 5-triphosphate diphosphatase [unclassified Neorhizobium]MCJ9668978.1 alpha-D-ribose 1-methylphosphonate 5-triphosphate diphosphatase [Neorhizobium sp. SHOUNA12B]MCJ9744932.1 alpha-D-ribose 1-methylphosphonate 5-triphosphate diphosphatase [Neorhizobium sp. SHOUNA12A]
MMLKNCRALIDGMWQLADIEVMKDKILQIGSQTLRDIPGYDFEGDYIVAGFVDLHVDYVDKLTIIRPGFKLPTKKIFSFYDRVISSSGITTCCDSIQLQTRANGVHPLDPLKELGDALKVFRGQLTSKHCIHIRCEILDENIVDYLADFLQHYHELVAAISLMEHVPGRRQFKTLDSWMQAYHVRLGFSQSEATSLLDARTRNEASRSSLLSSVHEVSSHYGKTIFSHDDENEVDVIEAKQLGVSLSEFPTTFSAAKFAKDYGIPVLVGSPNILNGRSHVGNVAAHELIDNGLASVISSDYAPHTLMPAVWSNATHGDPSAATIEMVTSNPASVIGRSDVGRIEPDRSADFVQVKLVEGEPFIRSVFANGIRVS